jgi:hypothetical protein
VRYEQHIYICIYIYKVKLSPVTGRGDQHVFPVRYERRLHITEENYPRNGLWDIEEPTLSRQSAHRWQEGCQPYVSAAALLPRKIFFCFWYSFLLEPE